MAMAACISMKKKPFNILASHVALDHFLVATPPSLPHPHSPPCGNSPRALLRGSGHAGGPSGAGCTCPQRRVPSFLLCY
eukprot:scaffold102757_cov36-Tisochrysis_lutea.AAC.1